MTIIKPQMHDQIWLEKNQIYGTLTYMTKDSMDETIALRTEIRDEMEEKDWFADSSRKDFEDALEYGFELVCIVDQKVIASLQCLLAHTHYSRDLFETEEEQMQCADYSDVFVHSSYRGNKLQNIMEKKMEELCRLNKKSILLGTVDPHNQYSLDNFRKSGYQVYACLQKYGGLNRYLMGKRLKRI